MYDLVSIMLLLYALHSTAIFPITGHSVRGIILDGVDEHDLREGRECGRVARRDQHIGHVTATEQVPQVR